MRFRCALVSIPLLLVALAAGGTTIHVPGGQPTVQAGLDAAAPGDTVEVACGTYNEYDIAMKSGVVLRSETGEADCVTIDAMTQSRVFFCEDLSDSTRIEGLTITRGSATGDYPSYIGGGMWCFNASPALVNVAFVDNEADSRGGGLSCRYASHPVLTGCVFSGNVAGTGGGMDCWEGPAPTLTNVIFVGNEADYGGGMSCYNSSPVLANVTFAANSADEGAGLHCSHYADPTVTNSVIAFSERGEAVACFGRGEPDISQCIVFANAGGDTICSNVGEYLITDPLCCDIYAGDFGLCDNSPCLPANNAWVELIGAFSSTCGSCESPVEPTTWGTIKAMFR